MSESMHRLRELFAERKKVIGLVVFALAIIILIIVLCTTLVKTTDASTKAVPDPLSVDENRDSKSIAVAPMSKVFNESQLNIPQRVPTEMKTSSDPYSAFSSDNVRQSPACADIVENQSGKLNSKDVYSADPCDKGIKHIDDTLANDAYENSAIDEDALQPTKTDTKLHKWNMRPAMHIRKVHVLATLPKRIFEYRSSGFDWNDPNNWEQADGSSVPPGIIQSDRIKLTSANSKQPIRTKLSWAGEKIIIIEWQRSQTSDTNIWLLNAAISPQFGINNGWPRLGELDIFEMFTQDAKDNPQFDFTGNGNTPVANYGQFTMHFGPDRENPCFCPSSATKAAWYKGHRPMVGSCNAQFTNDEKNSIAIIFGRESNGQFIQLVQKPKLTKGDTFNGVDTYKIDITGVVSTEKIRNDNNFFWGVPVSNKCAAAGGHDPKNGFPFFENFRLVLEEQEKTDPSAHFQVTNIQILTKS